jgi:hypothetical protein
MNSKFAIIAAAGIVSGLAWLWIARDEPQDLAGAEAATEIAGEQPERQAAPKREGSARTASPPTPTRTASRERTAGEPEGARSPSTARDTDAPRERKRPARRARAVDARDRDGATDDSEIAPGSEEVARIKQLLEAFRNGSPATPGAELDAADLSPEDMDRLDLNEDQEISSWEQERARRLLQRAERHPRKNDLEDGSYPVEREDYGGSDWEFDAVDSDQDDVMDVDEYHAFLVETEKLSLSLDTDGDQNISYEESGLSADDFAPLDRDESGDLRSWEIRRAFTLGAFD